LARVKQKSPEEGRPNSRRLENNVKEVTPGLDEGDPNPWGQPKNPLGKMR